MAGDDHADKAQRYAEKAEQQLDEAPQRAAVYASLAAYHQLKASADENAALSDALRKHAAAMEDFGPRR